MQPGPRIATSRLMPAGSLKIEGAAFAITVDAERRILRDATIVVEGQVITHVGKSPTLEAVQADRVIDAAGFVATPGFVNGHVHISYAHAVRGIFRDDVVGQERLAQVFRLQSAMTEEEEYATSLLAIVELLKGGTVTFLDPGSTKYLDACLQAYADSGCRIITGESLVDRPSPLQLPHYPTHEALARTERAIRTYDHRLQDRVRVWAMPFGTDVATPELLVGVKRLADAYGTGVTLHHSSGGSVAARFQHEHGLSPTRFLEKLGVLGPNVLLSHATGIDDDEVEAIATTGSPVVICPSTAFKEGAGLADRKVGELLKRGVDVGLGSDSANSSNYLDAVRAINAMAVGVKVGQHDIHLVPAEQAVEMATRMGARACGLGAEIGSIEVGKRADLVLFDARRAEWRALTDPINNLVYSADGRSVHTVVADGRVVIENFQATFVDEARLTDQVQALGEGLLARTGTRPPRSRWPIV
jgi:cytosine/adenosine deaminase-related metal-dependent hydrolase